ncbi:MAG TPA: tRNA (adenosine(37)-N6)-threonylcarbamoyltransferase complex transferase subunit TsaD [Clostridiales bacterium]|jgi:N6-L-threonylcarbamoyladenine synthase|nr:tRNA (adenosine(37)-N6)-threonylcarbamoyltransferase complex transferase subunit TsaD [Clostridiales bacterium]HBE13976.1 tRNA (adenosine(37)-N6)-threonylcarbamoyltransferase complex transferase subunit TsaD [Clostridiales bacterium]HCG35531.1 tRNA (adenosine(37)-N6)-threonylcarbamoyltransferase complex transferase subunit TsaD [Clostridiales bacterium]
MRILAFESSCDETAVAVVENGRKILSDKIASQIELHRRFGGVVPEVASRAHTEAIVPLTRQALEEAGCTLGDMDAIAVTHTPGLLGALLVAVGFAKSLAYSTGKPLVGVNHIHAHVAACYLAYPALKPPFLALVISGGHTAMYQVDDYTTFTRIGTTRDDAAGEAFDKIGRVLGVPYPGGKVLDEMAKSGKKGTYAFPQPLVKDSKMDFSFSGLKTAVINRLHNDEQKGILPMQEDVAADLTDVVVSALKNRVIHALEVYPTKKIVLAGGVSANSHIRKGMQELCSKKNICLYVPPLSLCGDNGAMVGAQGYYDLIAGKKDGIDLNAYATGEVC